MANPVAIPVANPVLSEELLSPAQRRRRAARSSLRETSAMAELLMQECSCPLNPVKAIECQDCSFSSTDRIEEYHLAKSIHCAILSSQKDMLQDLLSAFPTKATKLLLSEQTASEQEIEAPLQEIDETTRTTPLPIHVAAVIGDPDVFEMLVVSDVESVKLANSAGETALHLAVKNGSHALVYSVVKTAPATCSYLDDEGKLPIHVAVGEASMRNHDAPLITSTLLANYPRSMLIHDGFGLLPLHVAAKHGFVAGLRGLLAVNSKCVYDRTLHDRVLAIDLALQGHDHVLQSLHDLKVHSSNDAISDLSSVEDTEEASLSASIQAVTLQPQEESTNVARNNHLPLNESELLNLKVNYQECIDMLLMSALYCRAVFCPREEVFDDAPSAPFFLPFHAALVTRVLPESWERLKLMYESRHNHDVDRYGRTVLHAAADACCIEEERYSDAQLVKIVKDAHNMDPLAIFRPDYLGLLPLQTAILNGACVEVVKTMVEIAPETVKARFTGHP